MDDKRSVGPRRRRWWRRQPLLTALVVSTVLAGAVLAIPHGVSRADAAANPAPVADLYAIPTSGTVSLPVNFDGSMSSPVSGSITSWDLDFGDGTPDATGTGAPGSPTASHTYVTAGIFTATLTVESSDGESAASTSTITANAPAPTPPVVVLAESTGSGAAPLAESFDGSSSTASSGTIASWDLSYGDGTPDATGSGPLPSPTATHTYSSAGTYTATLTVQDSTGLSSTGTAAVDVSAGPATPPTVVLATSTGSGVAPLAVTLDGSATTDIVPIASWQLDYGDGSPVASGSGPPPSPTGATHSYATPGTYTATLSVTDDAGLTGTATVTEDVLAHPPNAELSAVPGSNSEGIHKIKHVVMIMQENRSFDSYFGTYPGATGIPMKNGVPTVCVPDPSLGHCVSPYHDPTDVNYGGPHAASDFKVDYDNGKMNGFVSDAEAAQPPACGTNPCTSPGASSPTDVMGYHDAREIPNYWDYAEHYTLDDHMFESEASWSLPSHLGLVSLWSAICSTPDVASSCKSSLSPQQPDAGADYAWTDITWLLHMYGVSWKYYVGAGAQPDCTDDAASCPATSQSSGTAGIWNPLVDFDDVKADGQLGNIVATSQFYTAASNGTLPAVSWVVPSSAVSEHPPSPIDAGQSYVTGLINAVMAGPDWSSTAIILSWDDWGGFYDSVKPPVVDALGYGFRVPTIVISPYSKAGVVDHSTLSFDAFAKFIETDFLNGARLDPATDGRPDPRPDVRENAAILANLTSNFNFNQAPLPPLILNSAAPWGPVTGPSRAPIPIVSTAPETVSFNASASNDPGGSIASWSVSFGDGSSASGKGQPHSPTTSHTYATAGSYQATLTVVASNGTSASTVEGITVDPPPPIPVLSGSISNGPAPANGVTFSSAGTSDAGSTISSWDLTYGDGSTDATGTGVPPTSLPSHSYLVAGSYTPTLTVTDADGNTASAPFELTVTAPVTLNPTSMQTPGRVTVTSTGFQPGESVGVAYSPGQTSEGGASFATLTATTTGTIGGGVILPSNLASGLYRITLTGQSSGITGYGQITVYANWAQFRYSAAGTGVNPYEQIIGVGNVGTLTSAGWTGLTKGPIASSPVVQNDNVYVGSEDDNLYEFSSTAFDRLSVFPTGGPIVGTPVTSGNQIYWGSEDGDLWEAPDNCSVIKNDTTCLRKVLATLGGPIESSPTVSASTLFVGDQNDDLYAVSPKTGQVLWTLTTGGPVASSPAVGSGVVIVGSEDDNVYGVNPTTGATLFTLPTGGAVDSSPAIDGKEAFVGSDNGLLYAFPTTCSATCTPTWTATTGGAIASSPAVSGGTVYVGSDDGNLYAFNEATGALEWTMPTGGAVTSSPAVANGVVYVGSSDDSVYAVAAAGCGQAVCAPLWSAATGGAVTSSPAVSDGRLYIGSTDDQLHVYVPSSSESVPKGKA